MDNQDLRTAKYQKHLQAIEDHKSIVERLHKSDAKSGMDNLKASAEQVTLTLEEYFKDIGIP